MPSQPELLPALGAVAQVQIDESLVRHAQTFAEGLEVGQCGLVEADRHLLFQTLGAVVSALRVEPFGASLDPTS